MTRSMAMKHSTKATKRDNKSSNKETLKKMAKDNKTSAKIAVHNGFITLVFALAMFLTCIVATETTFAVVGLTVGNACKGSFEMAADMMIVIFVAVIMVCGFALFFAIKIENWLISAMRKRLWHKDKTTGEIVKNTIVAADAQNDAAEK